jgi:predicted GNAT family acetyltransferase
MTPDPTTPPPAIVHDASARRWWTVVDGHEAHLDYEDVGSIRTYTHTWVPPELRGRNIAGLLVAAALADDEAQGRKVYPRCSYVARWIDRHHEFAALVATR